MSDADSRDQVLVMPWLHRRMQLDLAVAASVLTTSLWGLYVYVRRGGQPWPLSAWLWEFAHLAIFLPVLFLALWIVIDIYLQVLTIALQELNARTGRRPWLSFHLSTLLWLSLAASVLLWGNIRERECSIAFIGSENWHPYVEIADAPNARGQGWPQAFRIVTASGVAQWNPGTLVTNSLCCAGLCLALAYCAEYRARYRKPPRQPP